MRKSIDDFLRNRRRGPDGEKILRQADGLKINLYRRSNGEISGTFEIEGSFGPSLLRPCDDDDGDSDFNATPPDPLEQTEAQGLEFMRGLLAAFERERPRGGGGGEGRGGDDGDGDDGGAKIRAG